MSDAIGLSIGTMNLIAARPGRPPVSRRSVLTLWDGSRPPDIGVPSQNPELTSPNLSAMAIVLRGFVERVGDPVPIVASDGSAHRGEALLALGLDAMARIVEPAPSAVVIAAPAYWGPAAIGALRGALRTSPTLSPQGVPPLIISDATAALAALRSDPGLPSRGVIALCDFGAGGTSISLADAGASLAPIGETMRIAEFSGDQIDQALLNHVLAGLRTASRDDTAGTAAVGPLTRLREECRLAKERLSTDVTATVPAELPGYRADVRLTRAELEEVTSPSLGVFLDALGDILEHNGIPGSNVAAVAAVGGGAAMPLISQRLSELLRVPVITKADPGLIAAAGAALLAAGGTAADSPTSIAVTAADAPTGLAPSAWAASTAGRAASESASDGAPSATYRALAWSQDDDAAKEPVPYAGEDYQPEPAYPEPGHSHNPYADPAVRPIPDGGADVPASLEPPLPPWYRRPALVFGIAAALAAIAVGGLAIKLTDSESTPTTTTTRVTKPGEQPESRTPEPPPPPTTITVTGSNGQTTVTTVTPPPTTTQAPPPTSTSTPAPSTTTPSTTTTTTPTTTTTTTTTTPTTTSTTTTTTPTTTTPPTTRTTTTTQPPVTTTTAPPVTTTAAPPTTTAVPITTTAAPVVTTTVAPAITTQAVVPESAVTVQPATGE